MTSKKRRSVQTVCQRRGKYGPVSMLIITYSDNTVSNAVSTGGLLALFGTDLPAAKRYYKTAN